MFFHQSFKMNFQLALIKIGIFSPQIVMALYIPGPHIVFVLGTDSCDHEKSSEFWNYANLLNEGLRVKTLWFFAAV